MTDDEILIILAAHGLSSGAIYAVRDCLAFDSHKRSHFPWRSCKKHGPDKPEVWGCPECLREMRAAAIKLIRAKGRYHTEIATKELAALYGIELKVYAEPDAIDQLRQVFECARRVLRNDGVDRARFDAAMIALDEACEAVKLHDSELADESKTDDEMRADFEAWYRKDVGAEGVFTFPGLDYDIDKYGGYRFYNVHRMWDAWKGHANQREQTA